jgi:hypothetical protein
MRRAEDGGGWRELVRELASFERPSASAGERRAAELIAERLREHGCRAVVERERAHGGYWWPIALANAFSLAGAAIAPRGGRLMRLAGGALAGVAAAALWDDLGHGRRWFRRALLPHRPTWNVLARTGDQTGRRTVMFVAHHDAAHSGLVFHPALGHVGTPGGVARPRAGARSVPESSTPPARTEQGSSPERSSHTLPILYGVWLGPVLICAGALLGVRLVVRGGAVFALGAIAAMLDIAARDVVPGANDNLAAVGALAALAERLAAEPPSGVCVVLLSTGSEESFSEGMQAFVERHGRELDPASTEIVCLECLGGSRLIVLEGEGMLRMRDYSSEVRESLAQAAARAGVAIKRGVRTVAATDAIIALRAGYPVATLASVERNLLPLNYHWPTDVPEHLHWDTVEQAIEVCERFVRDRAETAPASDSTSGR